MESVFLKSALAAFLIVSLAFLVSGQKMSGSIKGTFSDPYGAVIPNAKVTLTSLGNPTSEKVSRWMRTDDRGDYSFLDVPLGTYELTIKVNWINRTFRKTVKITSTQPNHANMSFSLLPCSDEESVTPRPKLSFNDRAEIVRELIDQLIGKPLLEIYSNDVKVILADKNINSEWLTSDQRRGVSLLTRVKIQELTEKTKEILYYSVSKMTQRGSCVSVVMLENLTVKGQMEDANMAGGANVYEFKKIKGHWVGTVFVRLIS